MTQESNREATALYRILSSTESIRTEYGELAVRHKTDTKVLIELLMCAMDGVDPSVLVAAEQKTPVEKSFAYVRRKHWEKQLFNRYHEELESIAHTVNSIESGMRAVSSQIGVMEHRNTEKQEDIYFSEIPLEEGIAVELSPYMKARAGDRGSDAEDVPNSGTSSFMEDFGKLLAKRREQRKAKDMIRKEALQNRKRGNAKKQEPPLSIWFSELERQGYDKEKLQFVLSCIDEGMDRTSIERIIAPNLSVEIMDNLKRLEQKKEAHNE